MKLFAAVVWISLLGAVHGAGEEPWSITGELKILQVTDNLANFAIPRLLDPNTSRAALDELLSRSEPECKEIATLSVRSISDQLARSNFQDTQKFIDNEIELDPRIGPLVVDAVNPPITGYPGEWIREASTGPLLEYTARPFANGDSILLGYSCRNSAVIDWLSFETATLASGMKVAARKPIYQERSSQGVAVLQNGIPHLVGSYRLPAQQLGFELHILTARARQNFGFPPATKFKFSDGTERDYLANIATPPEFQMAIMLQRFQLSGPKALEVRQKFSNRAQALFALEELQQDRESVKCIDWQTLTLVPEKICESFNGVVRYQPFDEPTRTRHADDHQMSVYYTQPPAVFTDDKSGSSIMAGIFTDDSKRKVISTDGRAALLQISASQSELINYRRWTFGTEFFGTIPHIYRPQYKRRELAMELWMEHKIPTLVGFHQLPGNSQCEITVATAHIIPVGKTSPASK